MVSICATPKGTDSLSDSTTTVAASEQTAKAEPKCHAVSVRLPQASDPDVLTGTRADPKALVHGMILIQQHPPPGWEDGSRVSSRYLTYDMPWAKNHLLSLFQHCHSRYFYVWLFFFFPLLTFIWNWLRIFSWSLSSKPPKAAFEIHMMWRAISSAHHSVMRRTSKWPPGGFLKSVIQNQLLIFFMEKLSNKVCLRGNIVLVSPKYLPAPRSAAVWQDQRADNQVSSHACWGCSQLQPSFLRLQLLPKAESRDLADRCTRNICAKAFHWLIQTM